MAEVFRHLLVPQISGIRFRAVIIRIAHTGFSGGCTYRINNCYLCSNHYKMIM